MAYCKNCGNKLEDGAKFCPKCGTPSGSETKQDTETKQEKSSKKGGLIAAIVVMAAIALGGAAWYFLGNQQDKYSLEGLAKAAVNYDAVGDFHDGLAMVTKGEKYGFIDKMGNEVVPCIYDFMEETDCSFHEGLAFVHQGDNYYFIDKEGKKAFDFKYDGIPTSFSEGLAAVWKDGKCGYIDKEGNEVIPLSDKYSGEKFSDGMLAVFKDEKYGFVNTKGELLIPYTFEAQSEMGDASEFHEGFTIVYNDGSPSCVDKSGKELSIGDYSFILDFNDGMAVVNRDNKYGFIDTSGKEVIPCAYEEATSFSEGYAFVKKDGKYMQIDKSGKILNTFNYENIREFHDGLAMVSKKSGNDILSGYIDTKGNEVIPCIYTSYSDFSEGLAAVEKDGIYGFVDKKGNCTFDLKDEEVKKIIQAKIQEKEEKRLKEEEERRIEEEKRRIEEERRRGVEKVVSLSFTRDNNSSTNWSGNYGANVWSGMWTYSGYVMSDFITIPNGKVWIYNRLEKISGDPGDIGLFYYSRNSDRINNPRSYDNRYDLRKGDVPIIRAGDRIIISFNPYHSSGTKSIKVYFKEKDEDLAF